MFLSDSPSAEDWREPTDGDGREGLLHGQGHSRGLIGHLVLRGDLFTPLVALCVVEL